MGFTQLDIAVIAIVLISGLLAMMRGFVREVFSLLAWIGAHFVTLHYHELAEPWAHRYITSPGAAHWAAILFVFCLTFVILALLGSLIASLVRGQALTTLDRALGFAFGLLRGVLIVAILYLIATSIVWPDTDRTAEQSVVAQSEVPPNQREQRRIVAPAWLLDAKTRPMMMAGADWLHGFIPERSLDHTAIGFQEEKAHTESAVEKDKAKIDEKIDAEKAKADETRRMDERPAEKPAEKRSP